MNKIIIKNETKLNDEQAHDLVKLHVAKGRITEKGKYYYYTGCYKNCRFIIVIKKEKNCIFATIINNFIYD